MAPRKKTRQVSVGNVKIGGDAPVVLQTMTSGFTYEVDQCIADVQKLAQAGADVVRVAVPNKRDTEALRHILAASPVPIIADVHFHFERALEAVEAGVHKIRLNPGNIQDRVKVNRVIAACKERGIPIRIGVNEGSIVERRDKNLRAAEKESLSLDHRGALIRLMLDKLAEYLRIFEDNKFHDVVHLRQVHRPASGHRRLHRHQRTVGLPAASRRHARRPARDGPHSFDYGAGDAAGQRHRRHDPHLLRRRPGVRGRRRQGTALHARPAQPGLSRSSSLVPPADGFRWICSSS